MSKKDEIKNALVPTTTMHVVGTKVPKDLYYRTNCKLVARFTLSMPDGMLISVPIYEGESVINKLNTQIDHWYKITKEKPELFDHFITDEKCPCCGQKLSAHISNGNRFLWCPKYPKCK